MELEPELEKDTSDIQIQVMNYDMIGSHKNSFELAHLNSICETIENMSKFKFSFRTIFLILIEIGNCK